MSEEGVNVGFSIPRESVEAAARADYELTRNEAIEDHGDMALTMYCPWSEVSVDGRAYYMRHAAASIRAAINAWPGMMFNDEEVIDGGVYPPIIYLIVREEPRDE